MEAGLRYKVGGSLAKFDFMLTKEKLLQALSDMPEQFCTEELFERVILLEKIENGILQSQNNQVYSKAEVKKLLKK